MNLCGDGISVPWRGAARLLAETQDRRLTFQIAG
jgi:hypothetical protein